MGKESNLLLQKGAGADTPGASSKKGSCCLPFAAPKGAAHLLPTWATLQVLGLGCTLCPNPDLPSLGTQHSPCRGRHSRSSNKSWQGLTL